MHIELFAVILSLCGSGLGRPTAACPSRDCNSVGLIAQSEGLERNGIFDIFTPHGGEGAAPIQQPHPEVKPGLDLLSIFNDKNSNSHLEKEIPAEAFGQAALAEPVALKFAEEGIGMINSKYKEFLNTISPNKASKPINLLDVVGNLGQGLVGANKAVENFGKDVKTANQVQDIQAKAFSKIAGILRSHPDILTNTGILIDAIPDSLDFNNPEAVLKAVHAVQKLNPEASDQFFGILKDLNIDEEIIPKDLVTQLSHAIGAFTDKIAHP